MVQELMDSTTKNQTLVVCRPAGGGQPPPEVPSKVCLCSSCGIAVWRADSSPNFAKPICMTCFLKLDPTTVGPAEMTDQQRAELDEYYKTHPEKDPALNPSLEAFGSVGPEELSDIEGLAVVIERLCQSLRDLRREHPESFFGAPVERLYDSLEAALSHFYRARVESTSQEPSSDPEAS